MDRVKVALASLLPVLWLMASGQDLADPCGACPTGSACDSKFAFENGKRCPANEGSSTELSTCRANTRIGSHSAKGNLFFVEPTDGSEAVGRRFLADFSSLREGPRTLVTRWQFDCRAAPEPRAPSSVS